MNREWDYNFNPNKTTVVIAIYLPVKLGHALQEVWYTTLYVRTLLFGGSSYFVTG